MNLTPAPVALGNASFMASFLRHAVAAWPLERAGYRYCNNPECRGQIRNSQHPCGPEC